MPRTTIAYKREVVIGDTTYIVDSKPSDTATETVYQTAQKVGKTIYKSHKKWYNRFILNH